jgi:hypothetical protein
MAFNKITYFSKKMYKEKDLIGAKASDEDFM